jgi:telomerase reverse transcriptase
VYTEEGQAERTSIPGIIQLHPNDNLKAVQSAPWSNILPLLGADAELIFINLLLDCGIFTRVQSGTDNYAQLSGIPMPELAQNQHAHPEARFGKRQDVVLKAGAIRFVRHRMLYARASLNAGGGVRFGLHHTHVFQRVSNANLPGPAVHILKYVFPRQFGLHNVFTSKVDKQETTQKFKDYTFREEEITSQSQKKPTWAPRRLRQGATLLIQKIHRNHKRCSYSQLLRHYCPVASDQPAAPSIESNSASSASPGSGPFLTQTYRDGKSSIKSRKTKEVRDANTSFLPHATPINQVSAFCRAIMVHLLPANVFGSDEGGQQNLQRFLQTVDAFILMRRFENMTLHQATQGLRPTEIAWLSDADHPDRRLCQSEHSKRLEILSEFIYYIFDSVLIPVVRAHFYVTESSAHKNRLFYFRHDVWRKLSEPYLATLGVRMYAPIPAAEARRKLRATQSLGYSQLRLLPKDHGARPITNLKRRPITLASGSRVLGQSINSRLGPLFGVLKFESSQDAQLLGSAMFAVTELHDRLLRFKKTLPSHVQLFFARVDIKSCFDSIPQGALLDLTDVLVGHSSYRTGKYVEAKCSDQSTENQVRSVTKKYVTVARPVDGYPVVSEASISTVAAKKRHAIFSDLGMGRIWTRQSLLQLLRDHLADSMVKSGKRYMKQVDGIPQGSVLSSLLCSYFYGSFEQNELEFLDPQTCLLLRYIDDFLLVTTDHGHARRFLEVMVNGGGQYGIEVNPQKSLVNFDVAINGHKLPRLSNETSFPYCGVRLEVKTLELERDRERKENQVVWNTLTVDRGSKAGQALRKTTLASLKRHMQAMLLDMEINSRPQVVSNLLGNFTETAMKMHQYLAGLGKRQRPTQHFLRNMIEELVSVGWRMCRARNKNGSAMRCISRQQMCWLAATAFWRVLRRKQSLYGELLTWLNVVSQSTQATMSLDAGEVERLLRDNDAAFASYVF